MLIVYLVVFGSFACLFPLAFYCLIVAGLNNRRRPTLVPGPADFAGVLLATAGFLIVGGPLILVGAQQGWRRTLRHHSFAAALHDLFDASWPWLALWAAYFIAVVAGSAWLLWRRRRSTAVYNIDPAAADKLLPELLDRLDLPWFRRGGAYYIGFPNPTTPARPAPPGGPPWPAGDGARAVLEVSATPALRHLTLHWRYDEDALRRRVEGELRDTLAGVESPENPAAGWFVTAASILFIILFLLVGLFVLFLWSLPR